MEPKRQTRRNFIAKAAVACAGVASVGASPRESVIRNRSLDTLASAYLDFVEDKLLDDHGLVRALISAETLAVFTEEQAAQFDPRYLRELCRNDTRRVGYVTYENSLMATGEFTMSQIECFEKTGSLRARRLAKRCARAMLEVAREGSHFMPGYLPKPHGGMARARYSQEISTDQYTKCMAALDRWRPHADEQEGREIDQFFLDAAGYFIARNFMFPWRQKIIVRPETHVHALALYIPLLFLAEQVSDSDEKRFRGYLDSLETALDAAVARSRRSEPMLFNEISLFLDGIAIAKRHDADDPRLREIVRNLFVKGLVNIDERGQGWENRGGLKQSSWGLRMVAGASLLWSADQRPEHAEVTDRVLGWYDNIDKMRVASFYDPIDAIDGLGVTSWLLAYWRRQND